MSATQLQARWTGETGTYTARGRFVRAERDVNIPAHAELTSLCAADGTEVDLDELATAEGRDVDSIVEAIECELWSDYTDTREHAVGWWQ